MSMAMHNPPISGRFAGCSRSACLRPLNLQPAKAVLFVGPETPGEFREAWQLLSRGNEVLAINPRDTSSARRFRQAGGKFIRMPIEDLPPQCVNFDLIRENYPYPSGKHYVPIEPFAMARLSRLAMGGQWVLYTEVARLIALLRGFIKCRPELAGKFSVSAKRIPLDAAPPSRYPALDARYQLIVQRSL